MRTTIDIDDPILLKLKALQRRDRRSLGRLVSDLLAQALATEGVREAAPQYFVWISKPMGARINLEDKDAIRDAMAEDRDAALVADAYSRASGAGS